MRFPKSISPKVNVIARLEFELAYYDVIVQHFSHYATGIFVPQQIVLAIPADAGMAINK